MKQGGKEERTEEEREEEEMVGRKERRKEIRHVGLMDLFSGDLRVLPT